MVCCGALEAERLPRHVADSPTESMASGRLLQRAVFDTEFGFVLDSTERFLRGRGDCSARDSHPE
jgi:hypothetical protein